MLGRVGLCARWYSRLGGLCVDFPFCCLRWLAGWVLGVGCACLRSVAECGWVLLLSYLFLCGCIALPVVGVW